MEFYNVPENKIRVVYQSCDPLFYDLDNTPYRNEIILKYKLDHPYQTYIQTQTYTLQKA